jgi:hypothetical protein
VLSRHDAPASISSVRNVLALLATELKSPLDYQAGVLAIPVVWVLNCCAFGRMGMETEHIYTCVRTDENQPKEKREEYACQDVLGPIPVGLFVTHTDWLFKAQIPGRPLGQRLSVLFNGCNQ